jgi:hypothetical protein
MSIILAEAAESYKNEHLKGLNRQAFILLIGSRV